MQTLELLDDKVGPIGCSHLSSVLIKVRPAVPFTVQLPAPEEAAARLVRHSSAGRLGRLRAIEGGCMGAGS